MTFISLNALEHSQLMGLRCSLNFLRFQPLAGSAPSVTRPSLPRACQCGFTLVYSTSENTGQAEWKILEDPGGQRATEGQQESVTKLPYMFT